jgi:hypothetical protein
MVAVDSSAEHRKDLAKPNPHHDQWNYFEEHYDEAKPGTVSAGAVV